MLVSEKVAKEMNFPLTGAAATVEGDLDPRGVKGENVNPRIQAFRVNLKLEGVTKQQADQLVAAIGKRCPVYTTLERAAPIEVTVEVE